jgi:hypothetical protein
MNPAVAFQAKVWRCIVNMVGMECSPEGSKCLVKEERAGSST